jgi:hypothetical protein
VSGNIKFRTNLYLIIKTQWKETNYGTQNWNGNRKDDYKDCEIKKEELETSLKKLKKMKYFALKKCKTRLLKFSNEIYVLWTRPA